MASSKINIALVDDDQDEKYIFQIALDELGIEYDFHYFSEANSFTDYLKNTSSNLPNIVFLDMHMPLKSGLELLEEIRTESKFDKIRTVIYSNSISDVTISAFKSLGTTDFIVKPPELSEMKAVLKRLILDSNLTIA
jgi:DNA-binding NtrC family response regulator